MSNFQQPPLPYAMDGLKGYISEEQMSYHYGKHHAGYYRQLNAMLADNPLAEKPLEQVVIESTGGIFNNAAQAWNHAFFWDCMTPSQNGRPTGKLVERIDSDFGSFESFKKQFSEAAVSLFGSGWAWLGDRLQRQALDSPPQQRGHATEAQPDAAVDARRVGARWEFAAKQLEGALS